MHEEVNDIRPARNYNDPSPTPGASVYTPALNVLARWNYTITPSIINTAGLAYTYQKVNLIPTGNYFVPSGLFTQAFNNGDLRLPGVTIGNFWSWLGVGAQPNFSKTGDGIFSDDFSWIHGRHVIQVGGLYMWNILRVNASAFAQGNFSFGSGGHTGDTAGDFLLGTLTSYSQSNVQRAGVFHQHWFELYAQDDFKFTPAPDPQLWPALQLLLAVHQGRQRHHQLQCRNLQPGCRAGNYSDRCFRLLNSSNQPLTSSGAVANYLTNGVVTACQSGTPCGFTMPKKALFAPRLGFAYRLNDRGTMSVHGGYGIGYAQVGMFQTSGLISNSPYVSTPSFSNTQFSSPAGGAAGPPGLQSLADSTAPTDRPCCNPGRLPTRLRWSPTEFSALAYAGDKVDHIFSNSVDRNFAVNGTSAHSADCAASSNNINPAPASQWLYDPCLNGANAAVSGATQLNTNYYRPYPGYTSINTGVSIGSSNYHGLQSGFVYRLASLQFNAAYTYSKALGNQNQSAQGNLAYGFDSNIGFQNPRNPARRLWPPQLRSHPRLHRRLCVRTALLPPFPQPARTRATLSLGNIGPAYRGKRLHRSGRSQFVLLRPRQPPQSDRAAGPQRRQRKESAWPAAALQLLLLRGSGLGNLRQLAARRAPRPAGSLLRDRGQQDVPHHRAGRRPTARGGLQRFQSPQHQLHQHAPSHLRPPPTQATSAMPPAPATCARWSSPAASPSNLALHQSSRAASNWRPSIVVCKRRKLIASAPPPAADAHT